MRHGTGQELGPTSLRERWPDMTPDRPVRGKRQQRPFPIAPEVLDELPSPEPYEGSDRQDALDHARERVFEILSCQRADAVGAQMVELVGLHDLSVAQASRQIGISYDAGRAALYRARVKLAPHWDEIAAMLNAG
jgi:DNA-directed RNA polymerase specialized sigma24 family protein